MCELRDKAERAMRRLIISTRARPPLHRRYCEVAMLPSYASYNLYRSTGCRRPLMHAQRLVTPAQSYSIDRANAIREMILFVLSLSNFTIT